MLSIPDGGLTSMEAAALLRQHGPNSIPEKARLTAFQRFALQFTSPLIYILIAAGAVTTLLGHFQDSLVIILAVFVNTLLGYYQENKAENALRELKKMQAPIAHIIRDGQKVDLPGSDVVVGDVLYLTRGDKVPADALILESTHFDCNESMLTGEAIAVHKKHGDEVYMGTFVASGHATVKVLRTGLSTKMGSIAHKLDSMEESKTPLQIRLQAFARMIAVLVVCTSALVFIIGVLRGQPIIDMFTTSVAIAVAAIPEGLSVSLTVILALGMRAVLKKKALVKKPVAAETLGSVSVIATDKTGTLTEGIEKVTREMLIDPDMAYKTAIYANNLEEPLEIALWEWAEHSSFDPQKLSDAAVRKSEKPFSSATKYMSVTIGDTEYMKGAPDVLLEMCALSSRQRNHVVETIDAWSKEGLRMIGFAFRKSKDARYTWVGLLGMEDPIRAGIHSVMQQCSAAGIGIVMITGDYAGTAQAIWEKAYGSPARGVIEGKELDQLSESELKTRVKDVDIFARVTPDHKHAIVSALQSNKNVVALIGDGVNDALALKRADIGIVVGSASDVSKETADMILLDSNFKTILTAIAEGRGMFDNMRKVILYLLADSLLQMILVVGSILLGLPIPLTAGQILWTNIITDGLPSMALALDPKERSVLKRRPLSLNASLINARMLFFMVIASSVTGIAALGVFTYMYTQEGLEQAQAVTFMAVSMATLLYIFSLRSYQSKKMRLDLLSNPYLTGAVLAGIALQVFLVTFRPIGMISEVYSAQLWHFLLIGVFTGGVMLIIELTKLVAPRDVLESHR